ncbi:MAG: hypothetical protein R3E88_11095 [Myxococcota bacterium]|nr:hypothetical protein [Myxococcales bacterium]
MPIDVRFEPGGVRLRLSGRYAYRDAVRELLAAADGADGVRLLVDGRGSDVDPPTPAQAAAIIERDIPRVLERFSEIGVLVDSFELREGARRFAGASALPSLDVVFVDPVAAERWLAGTPSE